VDILYNYGDILGAADQAGGIAKGSEQPKSVAIIGAGAAGLVAAYELSRINNVSVTVYEATDRVGGRMDSIMVPDEGYNPKVFEMGCMRFPPTSITLFHYLNKFGLKPIGAFPDPGKVKTSLMYQNEVIDWPAGSKTPDNADFQRIGEDFGSIVVYLLGNAQTPDRDNPTKLFDYWALYQDNPSSNTKAGVVGAWQALIDAYKDVTYYKAVFDLAQNTDLVQHPWTGEDMNKFGALGVGSGGFGPLFGVNFLDIIRLFANGLEDNQEFLQEGIISLVNKFKEAVEANGVCIEPNTQISGINKVGKCYELDCADGSCSPTFDAVIVATTTRAMEYMGLTVDGVNDDGSLKDSIFSQPTKVAIRNIHLMNSSKYFVTTKSKFWYAENNPWKEELPSNMQTDELMRGLYCLDYDSKDTTPGQRVTGGKGVVLISYVWGDDSSKLLSLNEEERFQQFLPAVRKINPRFAKMMEEQRETTDLRDWESTSSYYGAFKLNYPGQEQAVRDAFYQFQQENQGVFMAGDSVSWAGGWLEGAMPTGVNAAFAVAAHLGLEVLENSPLTAVPQDMFDYDRQPQI
jgi:tryptophan 2-monooxygenase